MTSFNGNMRANFFFWGGGGGGRGCAVKLSGSLFLGNRRENLKLNVVLVFEFKALYCCKPSVLNKRLNLHEFVTPTFQNILDPPPPLIFSS